jgi:hypothetical protein
MNEDQMTRVMMLASLAVTIIAGLGAVGLLITTAMQFSWAALTCAILLVPVSVGAGWSTSWFSNRVDPIVFNNAAEREVLSMKQRKALRQARGEVVMEKAMIDIEHERANVIHNLELEAGDPSRPPHQTQFQPQTDWTKQLPPKPEPRPKPSHCSHGYSEGDCVHAGCEHY